MHLAASVEHVDPLALDPYYDANRLFAGRYKQLPSASHTTRAQRIEQEEVALELDKVVNSVLADRIEATADLFSNSNVLSKGGHLRQRGVK